MERSEVGIGEDKVSHLTKISHPTDVHNGRPSGVFHVKQIENKLAPINRLRPVHHRDQHKAQHHQQVP